MSCFVWFYILFYDQFVVEVRNGAAVMLVGGTSVMYEADLPGDASMIPGVALQVCATQLQLLLQLFPQCLRRRLQPELLSGELKHHRWTVRDETSTK